MAVTYQHSWSYQLHHPDFAMPIKGRLYLEQKPSESMQHLMMKACSFFIYYHPELQIERAANQRHKPDLIRFNSMGTIVEWIDCGHTYLKKLKRISNINHSTLITIVKKRMIELQLYQKKAVKFVNRPERIRFQTYEDRFIDRLSHFAYQSQNIEVTVLSEFNKMKYIYIDIGQESLSSEIIELDMT